MAKTAEEKRAAATAACRKWRENNREKARASQKRCRDNAPGSRKLAFREKNLRRLYDIGVADVEAMHAAQEGCCSICRREVFLFTGIKNDSGVVDHNHDTGAVRSILCAKCNVGLGSFWDKPELLEAAAQYLRAHATDR